MIPADVVPDSLTKTAPEPAPMSLDDPNAVRISLAQLAEGIKPGDTVQFRVASIDPTTEEAVLSPLKDMSSDLSRDSSLGDVMTPPPGKAPTGSGMNTDMLLGPMNKLKGYLVKKSQNVSKDEAP